jgi:Serine/threonine protein kinase
MSLSKKPSQESLSNDNIIEERVVSLEGEVKIKKYSKRKFLGKGGFARVYEFFCLETRKVQASKIIGKDQLTKQRRRQKLMSEIKIHKSLSHQNIVGFEHFFEDSENVYILLELCPNQSLSELLRRRKRLTELEVQCYMLQIIAAVEYIHYKKRDSQGFKNWQSVYKRKNGNKIRRLRACVKTGF